MSTKCTRNVHLNSLSGIIQWPSSEHLVPLHVSSSQWHSVIFFYSQEKNQNFFIRLGILESNYYRLQRMKKNEKMEKNPCPWARSNNRHLFHTWATLPNKTRYLTRDRTPLASMVYISIILYLPLYSWSSWLYGISFSLTIHSQQLTQGLIAFNC